MAMETEEGVQQSIHSVYHCEYTYDSKRLVCGEVINEWTIWSIQDPSRVRIEYELLRPSGENVPQGYLD
jgi:hypothetical protein